MNDKTLAGSSKDHNYPRPWRLWKAGERSEMPHIADANGIVIARAEGNIWTWQDFVAPVILAAVNDHERLQLVFEEACNEVKMSHGKPCFCKYCWEPSEATPGGGSATNQPVARGIATGPAPETYDQRWIREAKGTLDKLYAFLQAKNVPHAVDTREWIDNALKVLNAYEPPAPKAGDGQEESS